MICYHEVQRFSRVCFCFVASITLMVSCSPAPNALDLVPAELREDRIAIGALPWGKFSPGQIEALEGAPTSSIESMVGENAGMKRTFIEPFRKRWGGKSFMVDELWILTFVDYFDQQGGGYSIRERAVVSIFAHQSFIQKVYIKHHTYERSGAEVVIGELNSSPAAPGESYPGMVADAERYWGQWPLEVRCAIVPQLLSPGEWAILEAEAKRNDGEVNCVDPFEDPED